ncbi:hypothetical protein [Mangrovactinospora gilvigrisea]|nr:hypothetical protein [Mangrovactinospora gilvigrisea]
MQVAQPSRTTLIVLSVASGTLSLLVGVGIAMRDGLSDPAPTAASSGPAQAPAARQCAPQAAFTAEENRVRLFLQAAAAAQRDPQAFRLKLPSREGAVPRFTYSPEPGQSRISISVDALSVDKLKDLGTSVSLAGTVRPECFTAVPTAQWLKGPTGDGQGPAQFGFTVTTTSGRTLHGMAAVNGSVITELSYQ